VEDGATVRIFYESRLAKITLSEEGKKLVAELDEELNQEDLTETRKAKAKWTQLEALVGSDNRIKQVARDIVDHFETRQEVFPEGKAMVVAMSRRIAADLYKEIIKIRPGWHSGDLKKALSFYSDSGGKGDPAIAQEQAVQMMLEKLEVVSQMFHGFAYEDYFGSDTGAKLSLILAAEEHILGLENGRKRYINEVTALSQAFAIAIPHEQAMDVKDEVAFFQAVKSRLVKFEGSGTGKTDEEIETAIRQVIDKALVSEQVIDVFDAAGLKKPDISILSEDFLLEVKNMEHKNIALEVLKKLLDDEIRARTKKNLIQGKSLMEMLQNSIKRYHNKIITAAEVIEELIVLGKDIREMDKEPQEMGLSDFEYAFYTAIANNDSARDVMGKDKLRELAVVLFERVRENASIDWTIKESVKAKLKVIVKRTLRQYGYPPDMQKLATETVLKQAEMIAEEMVHAE
jgi:type I restriction enzyme R subunit